MADCHWLVSMTTPSSLQRHCLSEKAPQFWTVAPNLIVVTVLTPATTVMEGFTNHLVESNYTLDAPRLQTQTAKLQSGASKQLCRIDIQTEVRDP